MYMRDKRRTQNTKTHHRQPEDPFYLLKGRAKTLPLTVNPTYLLIP